MDADEITWISEHVAVTNFYSAHRADILATHRVAAILCLDREVRGGPAQERGVRCIRLAHLVDGANDLGTFRQAVSILEALIEEHGRVVVHCRAGRSRSIAVVAAYLARSRNIPAEEALTLVQSRRESAIAPASVELVHRC